MKIQSPWMGRVRGSAGNMTGSKVYDKNVLRAKAFEVSNPNTTAQQTERSFFAEVSQCVASVSEAELRTLFGVKPKGMSRRNALTKQVSEAYSIAGTSKTLDFSKLLAIGNGEKIDVPMVPITNGNGDGDILWPDSVYDYDNEGNATLVAVVFDSTSKTIKLKASMYERTTGQELDGSMLSSIISGDGYGYLTCAVGGGNVYLRGFGSFIIKTRGEK